MSLTKTVTIGAGKVSVIKQGYETENLQLTICLKDKDTRVQDVLIMKKGKNTCRFLSRRVNNAPLGHDLL